MLQWQQDALPCVAVLNCALVEFEAKDVFVWHLSLIIDYRDLVDNGMPSQQERDLVDPFCDKLIDDIKANGNALFVVRETWNKTRRLVWRVYDPEIAHRYLHEVLEAKSYPREFDYRIEEDREWAEVQWYLDQLD